MALFESVVQSAGIDYITATTGERKANEWLQKLGQSLLNQERSAGNDICSFWLQNYSGLTCGSVQLATNQDSTLIRLSSQLAVQHWQEVTEVAQNISRLDLQTTVRATGNESSLATKLEARALKYCREHDSRLMIELRRNNKTGQTLYCGSRKSDRFIRVYDKGKQSRLPELANHWRGEVELHRTRAKLTAHALLDAEDQPAQISHLVQQHLLKVGVEWPAVVTGSQLIAQLPNSKLNQSSNSSRLSWLRSQVAPTIARLRRDYSRDELLAVLGLDQELEDK